MELFLFLYLQPILCKLDLKSDFLDNSKSSFSIIFHTPSCYLVHLCLCQNRGLVNACILGSISVLMQAVRGQNKGGQRVIGPYFCYRAHSSSAKTICKTFGLKSLRIRATFCMHICKKYSSSPTILTQCLCRTLLILICCW